MIKVSIIIPAYNSSKHIKRCLESCINQTFKEFEVIVVNDGSIDNSGNIIDDFSSIDKRIKPIHQTNFGVVKSRKTGISLAKGNYLFFLDADDYLPLDSLEKLYRGTISDCSDIIIGDYKIVNDLGKCISNHTYGELNIKSGEDLFVWILDNKIGYLWGKLISKQMFANFKFQDLQGIKYCEDLIQMLEISYYSKKVAKVNSCVYHYVNYSESASRSKVTFDIWISRYYKIIKELNLLFKSLNCSDNLKPKINRFYVFYAFMFLSLNGSY